MYILEGNIGAGKSTFLKLIQKQVPSLAIGYEPLGDWQKQVFGESLLTSFYAEPQRWAYAMETFAMLSRVREHIKDQESRESHLLVERSIYSGHYCFALNSYRNGFMSPLEWNMYHSWFNFLIPGKCKPPFGFIYLRVSPSIALDRIKKRSRDGESSIPLAYLEQLHECHEDFLVKKKDVLSDLKTVPVLILDCNKDFEADEVCFNRFVLQVSEFLNETSARQQGNHEKYLNLR